MIGRGLRHLQLSAGGNELSAFHLEAEIAAVYSLSPDFAATDWKRILECYELLQSLSFSPVAELNRIVVIGRVGGAEAGLAALERLDAGHDMSSYNLFHITRGHLQFELGNAEDAKKSFERALLLTKNEAVQRFVFRKLAEISSDRTQF